MISRRLFIHAAINFSIARCNQTAIFNFDVSGPGVKKSDLFGWAINDFASSSYTTAVIAAVFAAYFVGMLALVTLQ